MSRGALGLELVGRTFEVAGPQTFAECGLSLTATVNPSLDVTAFSASLTPRWGANINGQNAICDEQVYRLQNMHGRGGLDQAESNTQFALDSQLGYGFLESNERFLIKPFAQFGRSAVNRHQTQAGVQFRQLTQGRVALTSQFVAGLVKGFANETDRTYGVSVQLAF